MTIARIISLVLFAVLCQVAQVAAADSVAVRSYVYDRIAIDYTINRDASIDAVERETFRFTGAYHTGWRTIPSTGTDRIDVLGVTDETTGQAYTWVDGERDKNDPANWGTYTSFVRDGQTHIVWYYDATDQTRTFALRYRLHGVVSFLDDHDELYWNLFTDLDAPVAVTEALVRLPQTYDTTRAQSTVYAAPSSVAASAAVVGSDGVFRFQAADVPARGIVTIAAGWPQGIVDKAAYRRNFLIMIWPVIVGVLLPLAALAWVAVSWYVGEVRPRRAATVIPLYEPPSPLPPAMAELVATEKLSKRTWGATVVDLAVRGYLTITEDAKGTRISRRMNMIRASVGIDAFTIVAIVGGVINAVFLFFFVDSGTRWYDIPSIMIPIVTIGALLVVVVVSSDPVGYVIRQVSGAAMDALQDYEKAFLAAMFDGRDVFATNEIRSSSEGVVFAKAIQSIDADLRKETAADTGAFEESTFPRIGTVAVAVGMVSGLLLAPLAKDVSNGSPAVAIFACATLVLIVAIRRVVADVAAAGIAVAVLRLIGVGFLIGIAVVNIVRISVYTSGIPFTIGVIFAVAIVGVYRYSRKLTPRGRRMRADWLGFKMYLETAERYRLQNLAPEDFTRFLPYAMVFGVEKKWAKAFAGMAVPPPTWYAGDVGIDGSGNGGGFSPSAFTSGFGASFASAFASSGGSGASGGGGSAGGGGGGGGGGAG